MLGGLQTDKPVGKGASVVNWSNSAVVTADDSCQLPELPEKMIESVGTVYDGRPTICGGQDTKNCYYYSKTFGRWQKYGGLDSKRIGAASVDLGNNRWETKSSSDIIYLL